MSVTDQPSLAGMTGVIAKTDGRSAVVAFGGLLTMTTEAWPLSAHVVNAITIAP